MKNPLFSILIAQYNNGKYFEDCYKSIIAQTYSNLEVIIVDDASTDNSLAVMQNIIGLDPRFHIVSNDKNHGCGYTKRRAAELAKGELCAFLDPDDAITPEAVQLMVKEHTIHPDASMIYSKPFWCDEHLNIQYIRESAQIENGMIDFFDLDGKIHHFLSFKKALYTMTEGINSYLQRAIDKDLVLKLYETGPAYFLDYAIYKYRVHSNGISMNQNQDKAYFWFWVTIINAAERRHLNIEQLFLEKALTSRKQLALQKEVDSYNQSFVFKAARKVGLFRF